MMAKNTILTRKKPINGKDGYGDSKEPSISPEAVHALLGKAGWNGMGMGIFSINTGYFTGS